MVNLQRSGGTFNDWGLLTSKDLRFVVPKGPFRTKNSTAPKSVVFCYRRSFFSLSVPFSCFFFLEKQALLSTLRSVLLLP